MVSQAELEGCIQKLQIVLMQNNVQCPAEIIPEYLRLLQVPTQILVKLQVLPLMPEYEVAGAQYKAYQIKQNDTCYQGQWLNEQKCGRGQLYNEREKIYYHGYWKNDDFVFGYVITETFFFEGQAAVGQLLKGVKVFTDKTVYQGKFLNGQFHDDMAALKTTSETYSGSFKNGKKQGKGRLETKEFIYEGEFNQDRIEGKGVKIEKQNGWRSEGSFMNGLLHGEGKLIKSLDDYYQGGYSNGNRHGFGVMKRDGAVYQGGFKDNVLEGWIQLKIDNRTYKCWYEAGIEKMEKRQLID